jgi:hypothetical protein
MSENKNDTAATEVIVNLWYERDDDGIIYSLRGMAYVGQGTDDEKQAFLQQRANADYLIAEPFEIPPRFHLHVHVGDDERLVPVAHVDILTFDPKGALFEDALKILSDRFPAQSNISIPDDPLVCMTPLMQDAKGSIVPRISGKKRLQ